MQKKQSKIVVNVTLDENNIPEKLQWEASDGAQNLSEVKAAFLSFWDLQKKETHRINLWTKDMEANEMKHFFYQTMLSMSETLETAIGEDKMAGDLRDFCHHFSEKLLK